MMPSASRACQQLDHADQGSDRDVEHGLRTPVGLKISGSDLDSIEEIGAQIESLLPSVKGTAVYSQSGPEAVFSSISSGTGKRWPGMD